MVRFAHLADCHIGAWRDPRLSHLVDEAFSDAVSLVLERGVDFVLIAGDLFHTALPPIDRLKRAVRELERLKRAGVRVYFIAGSHDFSPTGKTMLDVLEEAGLGRNVHQAVFDDDVLRLEPVVDPATGTSLVGVPGRAGQLDTRLYKSLDAAALGALSSPKIFLFHAALKELTPAHIRMDSHAVSVLPSGFDYYAGGHVHVVEEQSLPGYRRVVYPGPLFPASFSELEELRGGGFCVVDLGADVVERVSVPTKEVVVLGVDCSDKSPSQVNDLLLSAAESVVEGCVVLVRLSGRLSSGTVSDIDFRSLFSLLERRGAYAWLKNTSGVSSPQLLDDEDVEVSSAVEVEREVFEQYSSEEELVGVDDVGSLMHSLLAVLGESQGEGETKKSYEQRVVSDALDLLGVNEK